MATLNPAKSKYYYFAKNKQMYESNFTEKLYTNDDAIDNAIHYVTRTGKRQDRAEELVAWGAAGCCCWLSPDDCIQMFKGVQNLSRRDKDTESKILHEILTFSNSEEEYLLRNVDKCIKMAFDFAAIYFNKGFQCVFGIHYGVHSDDGVDTNSRLHIHFIINNVSFVTGNIFRTKLGSKAYSPDNTVFYKIPYDTKERESQMNEILYDRYMQCNNPYECSDPNAYFSNAYHLYPRADVNNNF